MQRILSGILEITIYPNKFPSMEYHPFTIMVSFQFFPPRFVCSLLLAQERQSIFTRSGHDYPP